MTVARWVGSCHAKLEDSLTDYIGVKEGEQQ